MGRGRTNGPTIPDASSDWLFNKQTLGCLLHSPIGTVSPFASPASAAAFPTPAPRPPWLLLRHAAPLLLLLFCAPDPPLLMLLLLCALALLLLPLLLFLFHMRRPAAPAPLPALPDDAASAMRSTRPCVEALRPCLLLTAAVRRRLDVDVEGGRTEIRCILQVYNSNVSVFLEVCCKCFIWMLQK
jgi:hypothetical protein